MKQELTDKQLHLVGLNPALRVAQHGLRPCGLLQEYIFGCVFYHLLLPKSELADVMISQTKYIDSILKREGLENIQSI